MTNTIIKIDPEHQIEREVQLFSYNNFDIEYVTGHQYFNATQMAQSCDKEIGEWLRSSQFAEDIFLTALDLNKIPDMVKIHNGDTVSVSSVDEFFKLSKVKQVKLVKDNNYWGLVKIKKGGNGKDLQGTFIHQDLAVGFAQWCNPLFRLQVNKWIKELLSKGTVKLDDQDYLGYQEYKQLTAGIPLPDFNKEENINYLLKLWSDECVKGSHVTREYQVPNLVIGKEKTRRFDLVRENKRNVIIYEIKRHKITVADITSTIAKRGYLKLARQIFNKPIHLVMVSPLGINEEALLLINPMKNVTFQSINSFAQALYVEAINCKFKDDNTYLNELVHSDRYKVLFDKTFLNSVPKHKAA